MSLILTQAGLAALVAAEASGTKVQATDMAVGDGGGSTPEHTSASTGLIRETWRGPLQSITVNPAGETEAGQQVVFEVHIPITTGGWYIRECALYADEVLLAIGPHPTLYKPAPEDPTKMEHIIKAPVTFGNAATVSLVVDPAVVLASQAHVAAKVAEHNADEAAHPALAAALADAGAHAARTDNPHAVTAAQTGALPLHVEVQDGVSLDTLTPGIWSCSSTCTGGPAARAGTLFMPAPTVQVWHDSQPGIWCRDQISGIWSGWRDVQQDDTARRNIALELFRRMASEGLTVQRMIDGVVDEYQDESGVDGAASANAAYDPATDSFARLSGFVDWLPTAQAEWQDGGYSSYWAWSGDDVSDTGTDTSNAYNKAIRTARTFNGDFAWRYKVGPLNKAYFNAVYAADEDATFVFSNAQGNTQNMTKAWRWYPGYYIHYGDTQVGSLSAAPEAIGDVWEIRRKAGVFSLWRNGVLVFTWEQTYTGPMRAVVMGYDQQRQDYDDLAFSETVAEGSMTLVSGGVAAETPPDSGMVVLFAEGADALALGSDLKAFVSRDDGATWSEAALANLGGYASGRSVLSGVADLGAQPTGTAMRYKVEVASTVNPRLHGVALEWR